MKIVYLPRLFIFLALSFSYLYRELGLCTNSQPVSLPSIPNFRFQYSQPNIAAIFAALQHSTGTTIPNMQADESFSFPIELFPSIIEHIHSSSTLASLARVNKTISILANEALYEDVTFETASALVLFYTRVTPQKKLMVRNLTIRHGDTSDPRWQLPPALPRLEPISPTGESSHRMSKLEWLMIFSVESPQSRDNGSPSVGPTRSLTSTGPNALFRLWLPALVPVNGPQGVMAVRVSSETDGGEDEIIDLKACDPALLKLLISVISTWDNVERIMLHEQCLISPIAGEHPLVALHLCRKLEKVSFQVHEAHAPIDMDLHAIVYHFFRRREELQGPKANGLFVWMIHQLVDHPTAGMSSHPDQAGQSPFEERYIDGARVRRWCSEITLANREKRPEDVSKNA
ncbi:hypothetical protein IAU59_003254 [Kwoniella sp. CBS 9459]